MIFELTCITAKEASAVLTRKQAGAYSYVTNDSGRRRKVVCSIYFLYDEELSPEPLIKLVKSAKKAASPDNGL